MRLWAVKQPPNPGQQRRPGPENHSDYKSFQHGILHDVVKYDLIGNISI
jgi:hypothetical protein